MTHAIYKTKHPTGVLSIDGLTFSSEWIGKELRELRNFSVGHLNDRGDLQADSPVVQALTELDGALTDLGTMHDAIDGEEPKALLSREEARQSVAGEFAQLAVVMGRFYESWASADLAQLRSKVCRGNFSLQCSMPIS